MMAEANQMEKSEKAIKSIEGSQYDIHDGVKYANSLMFGNVALAIFNLRNLPLRQDDLWAVGYPKSGNHWSFEILTMILNQNTEFAKRTFAEHLTEFLGTEMKSKLDQMESPRVLCSHVRAQHLPSEIITRNLKLIYILRNPKDIAVSQFKMWSAFSSDDLCFRGSFHHFFEVFTKGQFIMGSWFDHILAIEKFMDDHPELPVHVLCYEKMKENPVSVIKDLCTFLGKPDDKAKDIARTVEFGNMKKILSAGKMEEFSKVVFKKNEDGIIRKGFVGDWKNHLTVYQSEMMDREFEFKMANSKLARLVKPYM